MTAPLLWRVQSPPLRAHEPPETSHDLLLKLRDPDEQDAWTTFVAIYGPYIRSHCRRPEIQDADVADLSQSVLTSLSTSLRWFRYDPRKGKFRHWLARVVRRKVADFLLASRRRRNRQRQTAADLDGFPASVGDGTKRDRELAVELFHRSACVARRQFRPRTWQAFWLSATADRSILDVAQELNMSVGAVHVARCRVLARLKEIAAGLRQSPAKSSPTVRSPEVAP